MRLGIIGTGSISGKVAAECRKVGGIELAAVLSRRKETGETFAARWGVERVFTDMGELLDRGGLDAVYVASPNCAHCGQSVAAMERGLHVLCEKPIALDAAELARMRRAAEQNGVLLLEAMRPAFDPAYQAARAALPSLGALRHARIEYCQYSSRYDAYRGGTVLNAFDPALGNAAVMDIGVYCLRAALLLFGEPKTLLSRSVFLPNGFEGAGAAILDYGGLLCEIVYSKIADTPGGVEVAGEEGALRLDRVSTPTEVTLTPRGGAARLLYRAEEEPNIVYELREFKRLAAAGRPETFYMAQSAAQTALLDELRRQNGIEF